MKAFVQSPFFTIIIPTFNAVNLISSAIESVLSQSFTNFEILVLDNVSVDGTIDIIKSHCEKDKRIFFLSEKDDGIYDAMNKGVSLSKGEWLFFLGCDDSFFDNEVLMNIAYTIAKEESARLIYGNVRHYKVFQNPNDFIIYDGKFDGDKLLQKNICHQSIFYNHTLFSEFGLFNTQYRLMADWDFNLRCFNKVKSFYVDIVISNFYAGGRSATQKDDAFDNNLLENLLFTYPYHYSNEFFGTRRKLITDIVREEIKRFHFFKAWKASRTLFYHLRTLPNNKVVV
jgi:glycosyltransferase involved in cell wall biosynthesis